MRKIKKQVVSLTAAAGSALCFVSAGARGAALPVRPNVLFITTDDLNDNLGCYGHYLVRSPNIDRLAHRGLLFQNAYCQMSLCGPSRMSFMTGYYPGQLNNYTLHTLLRDILPDAVTLPQQFMTNGYRTARVGKIYHYDNPVAIGTDGQDDPASWNERFNPRGVDKDIEDRIVRLSGQGKFGAQLSWYADPEHKDEQHTDGLVALEAERYLEKRASDKEPFFLAVGFFKPHTPFVAPKKYYDLYNPADIKVPHVPPGYLETLPAEAVKTIRWAQHPEQFDIPDETARTVIQAYYATISFMDAQVGRVLDTLDRLGLSTNTIVLFSSDNGYHLGEHGHWQKLTLFERSDRVPLIIAAPGMKEAGKTTSAVVELVDFYPTLCELAGLPVPAGLPGRSLAPLLNDRTVPFPGSALTALSKTATGIRTERYRYTRWGAERTADNVELYDLQNDPDEMHNLAHNPEYESILCQQDAALNQRLETANCPVSGLRRTTEPEPGKPNDK